MIRHDHDAFRGFNTRMENLLLFEPLQSLDVGKTKFKEYNLKELGFATISYMLEQMLVSPEKITPDSLTLFLQKTIKSVYEKQITYMEAEDLRKYLVDKKLRNDGKKFTFQYTDFETGEIKVFNMDLIVYDEYSLRNIKEKKIHLKLSQQAIELMFKTKEIFQEAQITITVLFFKQQLDKGNYLEALKIAMELSFQIDQSILSFEQIIQRIKANVLAEFNLEKFRDRLERSKIQTEYEKEQIAGLYTQVKDLRDSYQLTRLSKKQQEKLNQIESIDGYIRQCMVKHEKLLGTKQEMLHSTKNSFELLIENFLNKTFNFEREIIDSWVEKEITQETVSKVLMPLMPMKHKKIYNPFEAFLPQRYKRATVVEEERVHIISEEEAKKVWLLEEKEKQRKENMAYEFIKVIIEPIKYNESYRISEAIQRVKENDEFMYERIIGEEAVHFIETCIELHRLNYRRFEHIAGNKMVGAPILSRHLAKLTNKNEELLEIGGFEIYSTLEYMDLNDEYAMTDFIIQRNGV